TTTAWPRAASLSLMCPPRSRVPPVYRASRAGGGGRDPRRRPTPPREPSPRGKRGRAPRTPERPAVSAPPGLTGERQMSSRRHGERAAADAGSRVLHVEEKSLVGRAHAIREGAGVAVIDLDQLFDLRAAQCGRKLGRALEGVEGHVLVRAVAQDNFVARGP